MPTSVPHSELSAPGADLNPDEYLDARELTCPMPLLKAKQALNALSAGMVLEVLATDAGSVEDFAVFARRSGNTLLHSSEVNGVFRYLIRKA